VPLSRNSDDGRPDVSHADNAIHLETGLSHFFHRSRHQSATRFLHFLPNIVKTGGVRSGEFWVIGHFERLYHMEHPHPSSARLVLRYKHPDRGF
jgi:hypothetical protein